MLGTQFAVVVVCLVTIIHAEKDCNVGIAKLVTQVNKPNISKDECKAARHGVQTLLEDCEASDPAQYVITVIDFVKHFAVGGVCYGVEGLVGECQEIPKCYKMIITPGSSMYTCGDDNKKAMMSLKCFQEQTDNGCHLGKKLKMFNAAAAKKFCGYVEEDNSSATRVVLSLAAVMAGFIAAMM